MNCTVSDGPAAAENHHIVVVAGLKTSSKVSLASCCSSRTLIGFFASKMGAYKYIGELYKKKQSDVLRFLLRVRCVAKLSSA